ncbi:MAG: T9SS type A sorting domain-containing protein, partial [Planctomycetes bacterium]|nr:T9SS type A sorting domain-containing protein [Planctomycetota bacterium]
ILDEVELFNCALSTQEVEAIYNAGSYGKCKPAQSHTSLIWNDIAHQGLGSALLTLDAFGQLIVGPIGSTGGDGVLLGGNWLTPDTNDDGLADGVEFWLPLENFSFDVDSDAPGNLSSIIQAAETGEGLFGSVFDFYTQGMPDNPNPAGDAVVWATDGSNHDITTISDLRVAVFNGGVLVVEWMVPLDEPGANLGDFSGDLLDIGQFAQELTYGWEDADEEGGPYLWSTADLAGVFQYTTPVTRETYDVDEIQIQGTIADPAQLDEVTLGWALTAANLTDDQFIIAEEVITITKTVPLHPGWNHISFNVQPVDPNIEVVLVGIMDQVVKVTDETSFFIPGEGGSLTEMDAWHGYWILVSEDCELTHSGERLPAGAVFNLNAGWNQISYLPNQPLSPTIALASIYGHLVKVTNETGFWLGPPIDNGSLTEIQPDNGLWVNVDAPVSLIYPSNPDPATAAFTGGSIASPASTQSTPDWNVTVTPQNCSVFGQVPLDDIMVGDWIGGFTPDGVCAGMTRVTTDGDYYLTLYGAVDDLPGFVSGDVIDFRWYDASQDMEDDVFIAEDSDEPLWANFATLHIDLYPSETTGDDDGIVDLPQRFALHQNYPNPFNPSTTIRFDLPVQSVVSLHIYDITGRLIRTLIDDKIEAGYHEVQWQGASDHGDRVSSGVYLYRLEAGDFDQNRRFVLLK